MIPSCSLRSSPRLHPHWLRVFVIGAWITFGWTSAWAGEEKVFKFTLEQPITLQIGQSAQVEFQVVDGKPVNLRPATGQSSPQLRTFRLSFGRQKMRGFNRFGQALPDLDQMWVGEPVDWSVSARCEYWPQGILRPRVLVSVRRSYDFPILVDRVSFTSFTIRSTEKAVEGLGPAR